MTEASPILLEALTFAADAHAAVRQARKGTTFRYVVHPIRVAEILYLFGHDDELATAGLLHDTIEDAAVTREQIAERFGERVAHVAHAWVAADGLPFEVDQVLRGVYGECELVEGLFEKETVLPTPGRASETDLLALLRPGDQYLVVGVEGKAREPFGQPVAEWNDGRSGKPARLADLCERLELDPTAVGELRYQLLHRTLATLLEAARYGVTDAVMLVQSFDANDASLGDYAAFAEALGMTGAVPGQLTSARTLGGIALRLGWAKSPLNG